MKHVYEVRKEKDMDMPKRMWFHVYVDGNYNVTLFSEKQAKRYIAICEDKNDENL